MFSSKAIVIGSGISSLTCANILAQKGCKVILCTENQDAEGLCGEYCKDGFKFSINPSYLTGMESGGNVKRILDAMNIRPQFKSSDTAYQVIMPDKRISLYSEWERSFLELKREFPKEIEGIMDFYNSLFKTEKILFSLINQDLIFTPTSMSEKYSLRKKIYPAFNEIKHLTKETVESCFPDVLKSRSFEQFLNIQALFMGQSTAGESSVLFFSLLTGLINHKAYKVESGMSHIMKRLLKSFVRYGGTFKYESRISQVLIEKGKAVGVKFSDGQKEFADNIVVNTSSDILYGTLIREEKYCKNAQEIRKKNEKRILSRLVPFGLFLGLKERIIPEKMADDVFLIGDPDKPTIGENALYIKTSPKWDGSLAPKGYRAMSIFCLTPRDLWKDAKNTEQHKEKLKNAIMKNLRKVVVFQEEGTELIDVWSPFDFEKRVMGAFAEVGELSCIPENFFTESMGATTGLKNLFHIGQVNFPYMGTEGAVISGRNAAFLILKNKS